MTPKPVGLRAQLYDVVTTPPHDCQPTPGDAAGLPIPTVVRRKTCGHAWVLSGLWDGDTQRVYWRRAEWHDKTPGGGKP